MVFFKYVVLGWSHLRPFLEHIPTPPLQTGGGPGVLGMCVVFSTSCNSLGKWVNR